MHSKTNGASQSLLLPINVIQAKSIVKILIHFLLTFSVQSDVSQRNSRTAVVEYLLQIRENLRRLLIIHEHMVAECFTHAVGAQAIRKPEVALCSPQHIRKASNA